MDVDWSKYPVVAFIDSNVALECMALEQLPWRELDSTGPILVLITPTVLQEVDSKKNHARLGDHARRFNKTLRPLLAGYATVVVRASPAPSVEVALADCGRTDWDQYPDLDREEADARVAAQALCTRGPTTDRRVVISHDIRPLYLAQRHGLKVRQIGDNWLRPKEISEAEKKAANLQRELDAIKSRQPKLELSFETSKTVVDAIRVKALLPEERQSIEQTIIQLHPMPQQEQTYPSILNSLADYDSTLSKRYDRWENQIIPHFVGEYEKKLELNFGQVEVRFRIKNIGQVPAESLLIRLSASGGWLNEKYVLASPGGPHAPRPRNRSIFIPPSLHEGLRKLSPPGKHEFVLLEAPERSTKVQITCADFRHGYEYEYRLIGWIDPHADQFRIEAVVTAANLHGETTARVEIAKNVQERCIQDLVDLETLRFHTLPDNACGLERAFKEKDFSDFEFDGSGWDK